MLARALAEDPLSRYAFPEPEVRESRLAWLYGRTVAYGLRYGRVFAASEGKAVAVWLPPERPWMTIGGMVRVGFFASPVMIGWRGFRRIRAYARVKSRLRRNIVSGPHWYLTVIGVDPALQGKGWGSRLVRYVSERADAGGVPMYLETTNERNIPFFERGGFRVRSEARVRPDGPCVSAMVREPEGG